MILNNSQENTGVIFITDQEASKRYGLSRAWFQRKRWEGGGPPYIKLSRNVLYPMESTDHWFLNRITASTSSADTEGAL